MCTHVFVIVEAAVSVVPQIRSLKMGRHEQKERERKRAAASCQRLDAFLPPKKKASECDEFEEIDCTSLEPSNEQAAEGLQKPAYASFG